MGPSKSCGSTRAAPSDSNAMTAQSRALRRVHLPARLRNRGSPAGMKLDELRVQLRAARTQVAAAGSALELLGLQLRHHDVVSQGPALGLHLPEGVQDHRQPGLDGAVVVA